MSREARIHDQRTTRTAGRGSGLILAWVILVLLALSAPGTARAASEAVGPYGPAQLQRALVKLARYHDGPIVVLRPVDAYGRGLARAVGSRSKIDVTIADAAPTDTCGVSLELVGAERWRVVGDDGCRPDWQSHLEGSVSGLRVGSPWVWTGLGATLLGPAAMGAFGICGWRCPFRQQAVLFGGAIAALVGPPILAGGTLAERSALLARGVDVPFAGGRTSLALYGGSAVLLLVTWNVSGGTRSAGSASEATVAALSVAAVAAYLGSIGTGIAQLVVNRKAARLAGEDTVARQPARPLRVLPMVTARSSGVLVSGGF